MPDRADAARNLEEIARRHGFGTGAVLALARALAAGGGGMAQFDHPDLGGLGQWVRGGMAMIQANDPALKARVNLLAADLAARLAADATLEPTPESPTQPAVIEPQPGAWWPAPLGRPSATGSQNGVAYAVFPEAARLAVREGGRVTLYDTGDHRIGGVAQGREGFVARTPRGTIRLTDLPVLTTPDAPKPDAPAPAAQEAPGPAPAPRAEEAPAPEPSPPPAGADPLALIERLAMLRDRGLVTEHEFAEKKRELLARV